MMLVEVGWECVSAVAALLRRLGSVLGLHMLVYDYQTNKC